MSYLSDFDRFRQSIDRTFNNFERGLFNDPFFNHHHHGILDLTPAQHRLISGSGQGDNTNTQLATQGGDTQLGGYRGSIFDSPVSIKLDVSEDDKLINISAEIPGINKSDVKLSVDNNVLTIQAKKSMENKVEDKNKKYTRIERSYGDVSRSVRLPEYSNTDTLKAKMSDGVLHITIEKKPVKKQQQNYIQIE